VKRRRPPVRLWTVDGKPYVEVKAANDLWTIDFKGWWRARNGQRCEPLTVRDAFSRYVLAAKLMSKISGRRVKKILQRLFEEHGVPAAMQCDNGPPWICTQSRGGLTQLSVWLLSLGIRLIRSRPACPQDNGGHERMHRDLSELELTPAKSRRAQQPECDRWMVDFNHIRPHDSLGGKTPAEVYRPTERRLLTVRMPSYPPDWRTRRVAKTGVLCFQGDQVRLGRALARQLVGLRYEQGLRWRVFFFDVDLGTVEIASVDGEVSTAVSTEEQRSVSGVNPNQGALACGTVSA